MLTSLQNTENLSQRLRSALPVLDCAPQYQMQWLRLDFVAGLTLAAYAIPVSLAYASLAGLPVVSSDLSRIQSAFPFRMETQDKKHYLGWAERAGLRLLKIFPGVMGSRNQLAMAARMLRFATDFFVGPLSQRTKFRSGSGQGDNAEHKLW